MKGWKLWAAGAAVATATFGAGFAVAWIHSGSTPGDAQVIRNGAWWTTEAAGATAQSASMRSYIARTGILALPSSEVIYFLTDRDAENRPLSTRCDYEVVGRNMAAQWWSLTAYNAENRYFPIEGVPASFNQRNTPMGADGSWTIHISAKPKAEPWIPVLDTGAMNLLFRLYRPHPDIKAQLTTTRLPQVRRVACA